MITGYCQAAAAFMQSQRQVSILTLNHHTPVGVLKA